MPPLVEFFVPGFVEFHEASVLIIISLVESLVHEVVELITAVEVAASFAWAFREGSDFTSVGGWVEL